MGRKLLRNLPSVDKLLEQLDKLELVLSTLDQAPTKLIQESLVPSMKALISDTLLRHTDEDVKVSVTSCFSEISRITAPDAPYDDEQMKWPAFEKLSHVSGRGYEKALNILDNVSKVRLFLVMLDLECDDLIIEMFQHFLRTIRSNHPSNAIRSMESIMTLVLLESEEISPDLLRPLLDSVRKENQVKEVNNKLDDDVPKDADEQPCDLCFSTSENPTSGKDKLKPNAKTTSEVLVSKPNNENIAKPAQSRKTRDVGSDFPPYEKPASSKDNVLSKPEDMREGHETLVAKPKNDENTDAVPPSTNHNIPDGSRPKRGRPRKISSSGNQDVQP
ncbi:hypothetical protein SESBI_22277 [Sesbania bispinosa]|nr:hypothetical protein SESBI_22277 [Sesbania bispinosa]